MHKNEKDLHNMHKYCIIMQYKLFAHEDYTCYTHVQSKVY